jgi:serine/threonine protein kinase
MKVRTFPFKRTEPRIQSTMDDPLREIPLMYHFLPLADPINPDLPQIVDHFFMDNRMYLIEPYNEKATLKLHLLCLYQPLQLKEKMKIFRQLITTVNKLHTIEYAHRNLTFDNIYYSSGTYTLSIDGFNFACHSSDHKFHPTFYTINRAYAAPEMILFGYAAVGEYINGDARTADIWSLGVILLELVTGYRLWDVPHAIYDICYSSFVDQGITITQYICQFFNPNNQDLLPPEPILTLLEKMLQIDPDNRWTLSQVIDYVNQYYGHE